MKTMRFVPCYFLFFGMVFWALTSAGIAQAATDTFNTPGNNTWTAPAGVTSVDVEVWGGGGAGGGQNQTSDGGGGGGGGAYSKVLSIVVTPGNSYLVRVGAGGGGVAGGTGGAGGDSYFINTTTVLAKGGAGGAPSTGTPPAGGTGGAAVSGVGTIKYSGGDGGRGREHNNGQGGPGGSSAGTAANGFSGPDPWSTLIAASSPVGGGIGGNGGDNKEDGYAPVSGNGGGGGGSGDSWGWVMSRTGGDGAPGKITITYTPVTTTLADGVNPGNVTLAPGAGATDLDSFTLVTSSGTDSVAALTVTLSGVNSFQSLSEVRITSNNGFTTYFSAIANPASNTVSFSGGTPLPVTTTAVTFKVRITPQTHAAMPVPPGLSYAVGGTVTDFTSTNAKSGTDGTSATVTIDNESPASATLVSGNVDDTKITLGWTTSTSSDFATINGSVIYRWASASVGTEVPAEGSTASIGSSNGAATVACVVSSVGSAALTRLDGAGGSAECTTTPLVSGQVYSYKVFQKDSNGNYDVGVEIPLPARVLSINRLDADPTSAATVRWTVKFSKSVTGVDDMANTPFSLAASGVSGAFISMVTGSGTTWSVTANTGIGTGTLGLNQSDPGSVVPPLSGTFTGQVYNIIATPALAEYRMDELSWNGTPGEVEDSSGNGYNGQAFNSANTDDVSPVPLGTCRYGVFDNGGSIKIGYVQSPLPNQTADFTITAWIKTTNNTYSGQRILIDDQNNSAGYGFSLADSGTAGRLRFYSRNINPIILDSTYTIANNSWYFVAAVADITKKIRTIYVYDAAGTFLNLTTEGVWTSGVWGTDSGPVSIGAETNTSSELPGNGFHFHGNLDEVRVYPKVLSKEALTAIAAQTHLCPSAAPDHYEIIHDGSALTCAPEDVSIVACADAGCTTLLTTPTAVTLSPTGWVGGNTVTFTGSTHVQLIHTTPGIVTLGMSAQLPLPVNGYRCTRTIGGTSVSCDMHYYDSGFDFDIPTQTSCKESADIVISAIGRDPDTNKCVPLFASRSEDVSFWSTYVNPNTGTETVRLNGTSVAGASPGTPVSLSFDANGQSSFKVLYNDAGQVQLNARYLGTGDEAGLEMLGSDSFVVAPAGLCVYSDASGSDCVSGDADCSVFLAAATPFALKVKGVCWQAAGETNTQFCDNATTANFRMNNIALSHTLVAPSTGVSGNIAISTADITAAGEVAVQQSVSEVGVFTFTADPPNDYLGAGDVFPGATFTSANIGRFIPHHFDVSISPDPPGFADDCIGLTSGFTYLGQPFNWAAIPQLTIQAMNGASTSAVTQNYEGAFWKLADPLASYAYVDTNVTGATLSLTPATSSQTLPDTSNCNGMVTFSLTESGFNYSRPAMASPVIPFSPDVALSVEQVSLTDDDNVCYLGAGAVCKDFVVTGITGVNLRHGQMKIYNNFGPETADITRSPFEVQYYNGTSWVENSEDNCTTGLTFCPAARVSAIQPVPLASGKGILTVSHPALPETLTVCPTAPAWLTALSDCSVSDSSCGTFTFGIYRGNDRLINWQEIVR